MPDTKYVLAIDQGTTSSRAIVFDHSGQIVETGQIEHEQIFPRAGWVEHDAEEIWKNVREVVGLALTRANLTYKDLAAVGITNQRETAVVWDRTTGKPVYNAIVWQDTRTQKIADELGALGGGADRYKDEGRPAAGHLLLRPEGQVDPRQRRGRPRQGGGRRPGVRQHRLVGAVEHDRRRRRRRARHRPHQRVAHHADEPRHADVERGHRRRHGHPAVDAARDQVVVRGVRHGSRGRHGPGRADRRHPRRPAGGHLRAGVLRGRHGQEHLRHRQLHAHQHGHGAGPVEERPADHGLLQDRRPADRVRARGLDRRERLAGPVAARQPRHHLVGTRDRGAGQDRRRQRRRVLRARRSRACSRRTGAPTPAARSSASRGTSTRGTSPGPRSRRRRSRPARCWTP